MISIKGEVLYTILKPISKLVFKTKFNVIEEDYVLPAKGEAFIIVGHHVSAFDPIILNGFSKRLIRFLYADANKKLFVRNQFLKALDMIPFSKNSADFKSIRLLKDRLSMGQAVGIYPEGGASWDGKTDQLIASTSKLIKMMNVAVFGIRYNGAYLSKPRWAKKTRKGKVIMNTYLILSKEDIVDLTHEEIHRRLVEALDYNEYKWQENARVKFKGKDLTEYIERLLYKCPNCLRYNSFQSLGNHFSCCDCGLKLKYNEYGLIEHLEDQVYSPFEYNLAEWNSWQKRELIAHLSHSLKIFYNYFLLEGDEIHDVSILLNDQLIKGKFEFLVDHIIINNQEIYFQDVKSHSITFGNVIEFYYAKDKYHLEFEKSANISVKLFYDCLEFFKEGIYES